MKELLSNIILFCGGANIKFLRENCYNERHKFYPIGLGVIITSTLGFISMMFASHSIFGAKTLGDELVLILFSLFWAFAIFTIDWGLIKTMRKPKTPDTTFGEKFKRAIPVLFRLTVALILSFSISRPMEVKIYEQRLKAQVEKDRQDFVKREWDARNEKTLSMQEGINQTFTRDTALINEKEKGPTSESFNRLIGKATQSENEYNSLNKTNGAIISNKQKQITNIRNSENSYYIDELTKDRRMTQSARKRISGLSGEIKALNTQINNKKKVSDAFAVKVDSTEQDFKASFTPLLEANTAERADKIATKKSKQVEDSLALDKIEEASYVSFDKDHPGLITQLESMSNFERTPEGKSAGWVRIILLLVIICIDTAPIVIKLLTKRGTYEDMMDADEDRMKFLSKQEAYSNNYLITQLALAQKAVLTEAVKQWKDKEIGRNDLSDTYVNSSQEEKDEEVLSDAVTQLRNNEVDRIDHSNTYINSRQQENADEL